MRLLKILFVALFIFATSPTYAQKADIAAVPGKITTVERSYTNGIIDGYTIYLPKSYKKLKKDFALMIFLHGGLGVGGKVEKVNEQPLPELLIKIASMSDEDIKRNSNFLNRERNEHLQDSFIVVSPHMMRGQFYHQETAFREMIKELIEIYNIDVSRIYVTGLSRGGHGTWGLASRMNDVFAAAVPIAGAHHGVDDFSTLTQIPIWAVHNRGDEIVDYNGSARAVAQIERLSGETFLTLNSMDIFHAPYLKHTRIFTTFDRNDHDAWTDMYEHVGMYKWMLKHRK